MNKHGDISWTELNTWDPEKAKAFYAATLGWSYDSMPLPGGQPGQEYVVAKKGDAMVCGIFQMSSPEFDGLPAHWVTYFEVADIDASVEAVKAAGGEVKSGPFEVPGVGRIAMVQDSTGAVSGYMQSAPQPGA